MTTLQSEEAFRVMRSWRLIRPTLARQVGQHSPMVMVGLLSEADEGREPVLAAFEV
jgi:hypothetical protein